MFGLLTFLHIWSSEYGPAFRELLGPCQDAADVVHLRTDYFLSCLGAVCILEEHRYPSR